MRLISTIALAAFAATSVHAAEVIRSDGKDGKTRIDLVGEIAAGDADKLTAIISAANDVKRVVATIRLDSIGGNVGEAARMAEIIKFGRISVSVLGGKTCASACFILLASGAEKFANYSAQIGVHGASTADGQEAGDATVLMSRLLKTLGVPPAVLGKLVVTPPSEVIWLTVDDLRSMNVTMFGKPQQVPTAQNNQQLPPPRQIAPPGTTASAPPDRKSGGPASWDDVAANALMRSAEQNGGKANVQRACQPEIKICNTAVFFKSKDGTEMMLRKSEDATGRIVSRDVCSFNKYSDVRDCYDFESKNYSKEMKDVAGKWKLLEQ